MSEIRTAVIGVGYLGKFHAQKYSELEKEIDSLIPEWHKPLIDKRLNDYFENPEKVKDFDTVCNEIENELEL